MIDCSHVPGVTRDPERRHGAVTFAGTRTPVSLIFAAIGEGGLDALVTEYGLEDEREKIEELLHFLAESCEASPQE